VKGELDAGKYGILLMHSIHAQSAGALQRVIDEARTRGMKFASVEDVVRARYGKSSSEVVDGGGHGSNGSAGHGSAGQGGAGQGDEGEGDEGEGGND
jgi:hypothetical protein